MTSKKLDQIVFEKTIDAEVVISLRPVKSTGQSSLGQSGLLRKLNKLAFALAL